MVKQKQKRDKLEPRLGTGERPRNLPKTDREICVTSPPSNPGFSGQFPCVLGNSGRDTFTLGHGIPIMKSSSRVPFPTGKSSQRTDVPRPSSFPLEILIKKFRQFTSFK